MTWLEAAACRSAPTALWFPVEPGLAEAMLALDVCARCPVREECLEDALRWPASEDHGIRGGFTEEERALATRGPRRRPRHPGHGTVEGYAFERRHGRGTCAACRAAEARYRAGLWKRLSPDDPRHGSRRGYRLGCRCEPCFTAELEYRRSSRPSRRRSPQPA